MTNKKNKLTNEQIAQLSHEDFVVWFMDYFKTAIDRCIYRRLIPNRYEPSDIKAYIVERLLDILNKRKAKGKPIREPKLYFRKLIDFYCIEYQRMHGFIYAMPKRPRYPDAEKDIAKYGFVYLESTENNEYDRPTSPPTTELSYIDVNLCNPVNIDLIYQTKNACEEDIPDTKVWANLMLMVLPEDRDVIDCIFKRNMSIPEISKHLNIAVSTAYIKKNRALKAISGALCQYVDLDKNRWQILTDISNLKQDDINIMNFYNMI